MLADGAKTVTTVEDKFDISRPAISKHIKILNECGIVEISQKGRERLCLIQPGKLIPLWIEKYSNCWRKDWKILKTI